MRVDSKYYVFKQPGIIVQQHQYLRRIKRNHREGKLVVYLNETWANFHTSHMRELFQIIIMDSVIIEV